MECQTSLFQFLGGGPALDAMIYKKQCCCLLQRLIVDWFYIISLTIINRWHLRRTGILQFLLARGRGNFLGGET